jgi:PhnB protein
MEIIPYIIFGGNAEAAFNFYHEVLGGELPPMSRYGDAPGCEDWSEENKRRIMNARLVFDNHTIMASDAHPDRSYDGIRNVSLALTFDDVDEAQRVYDALSRGGNITMPMQETFWARRFGTLVDRFGAEWMINGSPLK